MSLPEQAEIICICTERPDQEQIDAESRQAVIPVAFDAAIQPEDTSRIPASTAFSHCGDALKNGRANTAPDTAEKVITQAQTFSIFLAARQMASVIAPDTGINGAGEDAPCLISGLLP